MDYIKVMIRVMFFKAGKVFCEALPFAKTNRLKQMSIILRPVFPVILSIAISIRAYEDKFYDGLR